jgi:DNA primase
MDVDAVLGELAGRARSAQVTVRQVAAAPSARAAGSRGVERPDPRELTLLVERELVKLALQFPQLLGPRFDALEPDVFCAQAYLLIHTAVVAAGGTAGAGSGEPWVSQVREQALDEVVRALIAELAVDPPHAAYEPDRRYAAAQLAAVQVAAVSRQIDALSGRLQRVNPVDRPAEHTELFSELVALEQFRRGLREQSIGSGADAARGLAAVARVPASAAPVDEPSAPPFNGICSARLNRM